MVLRARPSASPTSALRLWQPLLVPLVVHTLQELDVGAALWIGGDKWQAIHVARNVIAFEGEHGVEQRRWQYNHRMFQAVRRERRIVHGEHAGLYDVFVPVRDGSAIRAILVVGPVARSRPTAAELHERWFGLTGTHGRLADPSFADYVSASLTTLTLEGRMFNALEQLLSHFAHLIEGEAAPNTLPAELARLHDELLEARVPELSWREVRIMVSDRAGYTWTTHDADDTLALLGVRKRPEHVAVGLVSGSPDEPDPVDALLRRESFLRGCVSTARQRGDAICGRAGDHGVVLLVTPASTAARTRARVTDLVGRIQELARKLRLRLHVGVGDVPGGLPAKYGAALSAAEMALARGVPFMQGPLRTAPTAHRLRQLREALARDVADQPSSLAAKFDRYIEAALSHSGYRAETARAHLWAGLERIAEPLLACGALDEKEFEEHSATVERVANEAGTLATLADAYRRAVADIARALASPTRARRDRGIERAVAYPREHYAEPLALRQVARVAGYAPDYFSRAFRRDEGQSFAGYLIDLRIRRLKQLLGGSDLPLYRIGLMSGFRSPTHLHRVFKRAVGMTPAEYRAADRTRG